MRKINSEEYKRQGNDEKLLFEAKIIFDKEKGVAVKTKIRKDLERIEEELREKIDEIGMIIVEDIFEQLEKKEKMEQVKKRIKNLQYTVEKQMRK